ncbi:hypothetical protein ACIOD2_19685 [Amycolatopsis sp. NPDC088138]|uniref:hypothetical protein n=1 Tax=Amycolatopsis sp. NPDC088138 TaxID=3363938 RepID=UPI0038008803
MTNAAEVDELVEKIIDRAIEFYMSSHGWALNIQGNYEREMGSDGLQITPPGKPERTSGGQVLGFGVSFVDGFEYGSGNDAGTLIYGHFESAVRDLFRPWRNLPDPDGFEPYLEQLREAAWTISMTSEGNKVSGVGNPVLKDVEFLQKKIGGDDMNGAMILAFDQNFCTPLPAVIHGQYAVAALAGATLCAEQEIWRKAREDVLTIARRTLEAMEDRGRGVVNDGLAIVTAVFGVAALFPTPIAPVLAGVTAALPALATLLDAASPPNKTEVQFAGSSPDEVIGKATDALKTLTNQARDGETEIKRLITEGMETVTSHPSSFAMPKPKLLEETKLAGMKVDLGDLHFLAAETLPHIGHEFYVASDALNSGGGCSREWMRPAEIDVSDSPDGPCAAWTALVSLAEDLVLDLAWEIKASAEHLEIASDRIGQNEAEVEAALRRHAAKLTGSGHDPIGGADEWLNENR